MIPPETQPPPTAQRSASLRVFLRFWHGTFKDAWFYVAAVILIVNVGYTYRPQLQIVASAAGGDDPLQTYLALSNPGAWTLYNVVVGCRVYAGDRLMLDASDNSMVSQPGAPAQGPVTVTKLIPTQVATRDCGAGSTSSLVRIVIPPALLRVDVSASYRWAWSMFGGGPKIFHFDTRQVASGKFILVPDVEERQPKPQG